MTTTTKEYTTDPAQFKDDNGRWRTASLFMETNDDETKFESIFTLAPADRNGRVSMRSIYMASNDPTEYVAAMQLFGSLECWLKLCKSPFFQPHLEKWRTEMQRKIKSGAISTITNISSGAESSASQLSAAKWLASQEWVGPHMVKEKRGRPLKERDASEALREGLRNEAEDEEDYRRITGTI